MAIGATISAADSGQVPAATEASAGTLTARAALDHRDSAGAHLPEEEADSAGQEGPGDLVAPADLAGPGDPEAAVAEVMEATPAGADIAEAPVEIRRLATGAAPAAVVCTAQSSSRREIPRSTPGPTR